MYVVIKRKGFLVAVFLIAILFAVLLSLPIRHTINASKIAESLAPCIIVDAGHGGEDGGAKGNDGTLEKDLNLELSIKLKNILMILGYDVIMTRETDASTDDGDKFIKKQDIRNRLELMEKRSDSVFVSIHMNKFPQGQYWGAQTFYSKNNDNSKLLALSLQNSIKINIQPENNREIKESPSGVYLLKKAKIPAVIIECGFLSNEKELSLLKTDDYRSKLAFAIALGIMDYNKQIK